MAELFWLNDVQWAAIEPLLPDLGGKPRVDDRRVISGIVHGISRRCLLACGAGCLRSTDDAVQSVRPLEQARAVAAVVRNTRHYWRSASGGDGGQHCGSRSPRRLRRQRGEQNQAIGRSRGGRTTKIHALADSEGRLYALLLTPGQTHDINGARALLASTALPACLIGDTAYDADDLRHFLTTQGCNPVISPKPNRINKPDFDTEAYKQRNLIERVLPHQGLACHRYAIRPDCQKLPGRSLPRHHPHVLDKMSPQPSVVSQK